MTLAAWLHDLSPVIWEPFPGFPLRWYGMAYLAAFLIAYLQLRFLISRGATPIPKDRATDVIITAALAAVIGGRLGYVVFYKPSALITFYGQFPYWDVLKLWGGGMASHGGMLGVLVAGFILSRGFVTESGTRIARSHPLHILDRLALITPPGLLLGRLANFINGELLGKIVAPAGQPAPWWAVRYPQEFNERSSEVTLEQWTELSRAIGVPLTDDEVVLAAFDRGLEQLLLQLQAGSAEAAAKLESIVNARHPSQLYQAAAEGLVLGAVLWIIAKSPRRAGVVTAWFMIVYGLLRILTEFWRLPDSHLAVSRIAGLSRGQWLSAILTAAGVLLLVFVARRQTPVFPGWGRNSTSRNPQSEADAVG